MFASSSGATPQLQQCVCGQCWVPIKNLHNSPSGSLSSDHANFGDFTFFFCIGSDGWEMYKVSKRTCWAVLLIAFFFFVFFLFFFFAKSLLTPRYVTPAELSILLTESKWPKYTTEKKRPLLNIKSIKRRKAPLYGSSVKGRGKVELISARGQESLKIES